MVRRLFAAFIVLVLAAALLVAVWPQLLGLERQAGVAQIVSLRGIALVVAALAVILLVVFGLMYARIRRFTGSLAIVLIAFCLITLVVLASRGFGAPAFPTKASGDVTVLSWNTLGDAPGSERIAELALQTEADVVVLPETSLDTASIVAAIMAQQGEPMQVLHVSLDEISKARTTSLLISTDLGGYAVDQAAGTTPTLPSFVAVPTDGDGPAIVAAHPVAPVQGEMEAWRQGLDWLAEQCARPDLILAGDLNSTLDHYEGLGADDVSGDLGACHDAARASGNGAVGTWPTQLPQLLGAPIDHVMTSASWEVVGFRVVDSDDGTGSDHRPVLAQVRPRG